MRGGPGYRIVTRDRDGSRVMLYGDLVEGHSLAALPAEVHGPTIVIDMAGVRRLNSFGVRELVNTLAALTALGRVELERASPAVVTQLNLLPELSAKVTTVRSLLAPMECPKCLGEQELLVDLARGVRQASLVCLCDGCGSEMDLAEPRDRYFAFLDV